MYEMMQIKKVRSWNKRKGEANPHFESRLSFVTLKKPFITSSNANIAQQFLQNADKVRFIC